MDPDPQEEGKEQRTDRQGDPTEQVSSPSRQRLLKTLSLGSAGLAGCFGDGDSTPTDTGDGSGDPAETPTDTGDGSESPTETPTDTATPTQSPSELRVDGRLDDPIWEETTPRSFRYRYLNREPIRTVEVRSVRDTDTLYLGFSVEKREDDPEFQTTRLGDGTLWRFQDDSIHVRLWNEESGAQIMVWVDSDARLTAERSGTEAGHFEEFEPMSDVEAATNVDDSGWSTELAIPFDFEENRWADGESPWHISVINRHQQVGPVSFPREHPDRLPYPMVPLQPGD